MDFIDKGYVFVSKRDAKKFYEGLLNDEIKKLIGLRNNLGCKTKIVYKFTKEDLPEEE